MYELITVVDNKQKYKMVLEALVMFKYESKLKNVESLK